MAQEVGRLRAWEGFKPAELARCSDLVSLPIIAELARRESREPSKVIRSVIEAALSGIGAENEKVEALQAALGITRSESTATKRRKGFLAEMPIPDSLSIEGLRSREDGGIELLLDYLIEASATVVEGAKESHEYWRAYDRKGRKFHMLAGSSSYQLGANALPDFSEWMRVYRISEDNVADFTTTYNFTSCDAGVDIEVLEGGEFERVVSNTSSQNEVRWRLNFPEPLNRGDIVRLRWRYRFIHKPGGTPPAPIFGDQVEVPVPWMRHEVYFHPDNLPNIVRCARGPLSGWPERAKFNKPVLLDPDFCARATWKRIGREQTVGLYWEWS